MFIPKDGTSNRKRNVEFNFWLAAGDCNPPPFFCLKNAINSVYVVAEICTLIALMSHLTTVLFAV